MKVGGEMIRVRNVYTKSVQEYDAEGWDIEDGVYQLYKFVGEFPHHMKFVVACLPLTVIVEKYTAILGEDNNG
jgi:hypothetical protein